MILFDTHAHLDQPEFADDRELVLSRAAAAGISRLLAVGITAESSRACVELAAANDSVLAAVGIQPSYAGQAAAEDWNAICELARSAQVVALGETGLDRYWDYSPFDVQQDYFDRHLRLSQRLSLPFVVHTRDSDADVLAMLREARERGPLQGVMHSFTGSAETAKECLELGLYISFAGMVTFKKSDALRAVAAAIPSDRILIETDSPYLSPHPLRGRRNEPAHLVHTAECLAAARGRAADDFAAETTANACRLFCQPRG